MHLLNILFKIMTDLAASTFCCGELVSGEQWCFYFNLEIETSLCQAKNDPTCPGEIPSKLCILRFTYWSSKLTKCVGSSELQLGVKDKWLLWMCWWDGTSTQLCFQVPGNKPRTAVWYPRTTKTWLHFLTYSSFLENILLPWRYVHTE